MEDKHDHIVAQSVETLCYKLEGRGFDFQWYYLNCSLTYSSRLHYVHGVDSASNRYEYQEYFLGSKGGQCIRLTNLSLSCAERLEI
jgi:hypothetical protein